MIKNLLVQIQIQLILNLSLSPIINENNENIGIVWIPGALVPVEDYNSLVTLLQDTFASNGINLWVSVPKFFLNLPNGYQMAGKIKSSIQSMRNMKQTGSKVILVGHSMGGIISQQQINGKADQFDGQILLASMLRRNLFSIEESQEGKTKFQQDIPTLTICGEKDGKLRVTRCVESQYHQVKNIVQNQLGKFPVTILEGVSHYGFSNGIAATNFKNDDLTLEVSLGTAHQQISNEILNFVCNLKKLTCSNQSNKLHSTHAEQTANFSKPVIEAMELEGNKNLKPACNEDNKDSPICFNGSPWVNQFVQSKMAGELPNPKISIINKDTFYSTSFFKSENTLLPYIENKCELDTTEDCVLQSQTYTQNIQNQNSMDTGSPPLAASEMRCRLSSRQIFYEKSGLTQVNINTTDLINNCMSINQLAIDWAQKNVSEKIRKRQDEKGVKLYTFSDEGMKYRVKWELRKLKQADTHDNKTIIVLSPSMLTATNASVEAGMHQCKVLSPFYVMEWMLIDGLRKNDSVKNLQK